MTGWELREAFKNNTAFNVTAMDLTADAPVAHIQVGNVPAEGCRVTGHQFRRYIANEKGLMLFCTSLVNVPCDSFAESAKQYEDPFFELNQQLN